MPVKSLIAGQVRALFADRSGRAAGFTRGPGLFHPDSIVRQVHGDVTTMMIGGTSALLMQMLHPAALAGIWDHSSFRTDMAGRLQRTAAFIAITTYGARAEAEAAIARVRRIHAHVVGRTPGGERYHANDPALLTYVHVAEAHGFLSAWRRYRAPWLGAADIDRYYAEMAQVAHALGAPDVPTSARGIDAYLAMVRPRLLADARAREAARLLIETRPASAAMAPFQALTVGAAIELMPEWARRMHGLPMPLVARPLLRAGAGTLGAVLRWAMAAPPAPSRPRQARLDRRAPAA